ncbi:phage holin family protein [Candidatus Saccharibacteria bacterium]|nr:phage holin family protein [Candidatus Saccharibacteria bacterium]
MLRRILFSWFVNFVGLWVAAQLFSGIAYGDRIGVLIIAALVFGIVNALIRPIVVLLSLPAIVVTLGIFMLFVNAGMLYITSFFYPRFQVNKLSSAIGAVVIIWLVNYLFSTFFQKDKTGA